jgi:ribonuclease PH
VALRGGEILLDPDYSEDNGAEVDFNLAATGAQQLIEVQGTAEGHPFSMDIFKEILDTGLDGIDQIIAQQRNALASHFAVLKPHLKNAIPEEYLA